MYWIWVCVYLVGLGVWVGFVYFIMVFCVLVGCVWLVGGWVGCLGGFGFWFDVVFVLVLRLVVGECCGCLGFVLW